MALDELHEQAASRPLSHDELVRLQRNAVQVGVPADPLTGRALRSNIPRGWLDKDMTLRAPRDGRTGRPAVFSNAAIQFCLSIKILFKLPLRQTVGMVASLLRLAGLDWPVPDFSTRCRRQKKLAVQVPYRRADGQLNLLVPSRDIATQCPAGQWMRCLKAFGERIMARDPDRQTAEIHIRIPLMNRFDAFGTTEIIRVA